MTRYLCPDCKDHPILDDSLICPFCLGKYVWVSQKADVVKKELEKEG